jgi:hypothetical protein
MRRSVVPTSPVGRLGAYAVALATVLGGGALVGAAVGPATSDDDGHGGHGAATTVEADGGAAAVPAGLSIARDGYALHLERDVVPAGSPAALAFTISGPDGAPVTAFDVSHERELHLVVVSRDLATYAHLHPVRDDAGRWSVTAPALPPGSYRVYADAVPSGHDGVVLGSDLTVPGDVEPRPLPSATSAAAVDGYDVSIDGDLVAGTDSTLTVTVRRDGEPVTDLQPYLGALGHLVAIRDGDLAYLHVHPLDATTGPGGPVVRFAVDVPTPGSYGVWFDFADTDGVHTAPFIATADASQHVGTATDHDHEG